MSTNFENSEFWTELCGTTAANKFGYDMSQITGQDKFDNWYISYYRYLFDFIDNLEITKKSVIEIGLGVGTVARYIAPKSNRYLGVDISKESCTFVKGTFEQRCYEGTTLCCSILELPESLDASFDIGIAIGSLHHTGLLAEAVNSLERTVKPGGKILIMVYNQFDLRRVIRQPLRSIFRYFQSVFGVNRNWPELNPNLRALCDVDLDGFPAPHTSFTTKYFFKSVSLEGVKYKVFRRNFHDLSRVHSFLKRENFLGWPSKILGCHLYAVGTKKI